MVRGEQIRKAGFPPFSPFFLPYPLVPSLPLSTDPAELMKLGQSRFSSLPSIHFSFRFSLDLSFDRSP